MSREAILKNIQTNKPKATELPDLSVFTHTIDTDTLLADFIKIATKNNSSVVNLVGTGENLEEFLPAFVQENFGETAKVYNTLDGSAESLSYDDFKIKSIDVFIGQPKLAVAENGCMWMDDSFLPLRIATFASEHTIFVVDHTTLVPTMHQAYAHIQINASGYGVFIAGPSKTADIEQSLVVGAQGAVSNTVILI